MTEIFWELAGAYVVGFVCGMFVQALSLAATGKPFVFFGNDDQENEDV